MFFRMLSFKFVVCSFCLLDVNCSCATRLRQFPLLPASSNEIEVRKRLGYDDIINTLPNKRKLDDSQDDLIDKVIDESDQRKIEKEIVQHCPLDASFDSFIGEVITGRAQLKIKEKSYPICTNGLLKTSLEAERKDANKPVTLLFKKTLDSFKDRALPSRVYNIHFILRKVSNEDFEIDVRPTARMR